MTPGLSWLAADGRKMLTPEITARILMGEIAPWREWDALLEGPGELRPREEDRIHCLAPGCSRARASDTGRPERLTRRRRP